jgi:hypothetical protein
MDLLHLVDRLEELVAGAQKMPIGNRAIIDRRRLLDLVDQMRVAIPQEVREAEALVAQRDTLQREAEEEARIVLARAEEQAARLIDEHEITDGARRRADELASQAELRIEDRIADANRDVQARIDESRRLALQQMETADDYSKELLRRLERQLSAFVSSVQSGIAQLEEPRGAGPAITADLPPDQVPQTPSPTDPDEPLATMITPNLDEPEAESEAEPAFSAASKTAGNGDAGVIDDLEHDRLDDDPTTRD